MSKLKQKQYSNHRSASGSNTQNKSDNNTGYDPAGNCLFARDLQIGNYVYLVYDKSTPRKVQAIYDNSIFLDGSEEPEDERDLVPIPITKEILLAIGLKQNGRIRRLNALLSVPYIHLLQQLIHLVNQTSLYADH